MITLQNDKGEVFVEIERNIEIGYIYANWIGKVTEDDVKYGVIEVLNELKASGYNKLLNNNKSLLGTWNVSNEWIPKAVELKMEKFAHVLSNYLFGQLSAEGGLMLEITLICTSLKKLKSRGVV